MKPKCCGAERSTPFCPLCGAPLGNPSPLVGLLSYLKKQHAKAEKISSALQRQKGDSYSGSYWWHPLQGRIDDKKHDELVATTNRWRAWMNAVEAAIRDDRDAKVYADWLLDNGEPTAADKLRGAFSIGANP